MTITYSLKNNTDSAVQLYKASTGVDIVKTSAGAPVRIGIGESVTSVEKKDNRYLVVKSGLAGWIDSAKMTVISTSGEVDPPPVDPPPPTRVVVHTIRIYSDASVTVDSDPLP